MIAALLLLAVEPALDCASNDLPQMGLNICAYQAFVRADAAMNAQWRLTVAAMRVSDRGVDRRSDNQPLYYDTLLAAQRVWLTFRDQHCTLASFEARGGSMQPMVVSGCKTELTRARTKQLKELAETEN